MAAENPSYLSSPLSDGVTLEERMQGLAQTYAESQNKGAQEFMDRISNLEQNPETGALVAKSEGDTATNQTV